MIYVTHGQNDTGQRLVGCPHVGNREVDMWVYPDGSAIYGITGLGAFYFRPTKQTIIAWCQECFEALGEAKILRAKYQELSDTLTVERHES